MSKLEVDAIEPQSGTTITIGASGDTVNLVGTLQNNGSPLPGDISEVIAGTGLSGGGSTGAVTINIDSAQPTITSLGTLTSATISGDLTVDTNTLFVDSSNNRVGIGTTSPQRILHIHDSQPYLQLTSSSTGTTSTDGFQLIVSGSEAVLMQRENSAMSFYTNGSEAMRISSSGNVGIGESSPGYNLVVDGGANTTIRVQNDTPYYGDFQATTSGIQIRTIGSYPLIFNTNQTERMRITDAGRIGIGSSSPGTNDAVLIENGQSYLTIKDAQQMGIQLHGDDTNVIYSYDKTAASLTGGITFGHADGQTEFKTGGSSTRMTIKPDGNVGIGLTAPDSKLHVVNTGGQAAKIHSDTNNSGDLGMSILAGLDTASSSGDCKWVRLADGNDSGKAYIQFKSSSPNAEFAAISDERLKTNIQDTDVVGLDVINNLRLVKFDWNDTATQNAGWSMTGHQKLGFVAQEVEQILPEFISEDTNGFKIMGDSGFVPYLIKAMQEQQTKIQELEARITQLENA